VAYIEKIIDFYRLFEDVRVKNGASIVTFRSLDKLTKLDPTSDMK
jgi:hypothetical protein